MLGKSEYGTEWYDDYSDFYYSSHTLFQHEVTTLSYGDFEGKDKQVEINPYFLGMNNNSMSSLSHDMATFNYGKGNTMVSTHDASRGHKDFEEASHFGISFRHFGVAVPKVD